MLYPALDVYHPDHDQVLALVDDYSPTAVEERDTFLSVFFSTVGARDAARDAISLAWPHIRVVTREVDDEDWARRSQENLEPVSVGRITIFPPWSAPSQLFLTGAGAPGLRSSSFGQARRSAEGAEAAPPARSNDDASPGEPTFPNARGAPPPLARAASLEDSVSSRGPRALPGDAWPQALRLPVIIRPSMAFGTGHHATTRLCLVGLQLLNLADTHVLDIGTGSGVLAIAARMLGAEGAVGVDNDADAIVCARENLALNPGVDRVRFNIGDLSSAIGAGSSALQIARGLHGLGPPDVVIANLTGDLIRRSAEVLANAFAPGGALIVSGVLAEERAAVVAAFEGLDLVWEFEEDGWVGLGFARLT